MHTNHKACLAELTIGKTGFIFLPSAAAKQQPLFFHRHFINSPLFFPVYTQFIIESPNKKFYNKTCIIINENI